MADDYRHAPDMSDPCAHCGSGRIDNCGWFDVEEKLYELDRKKVWACGSHEDIRDEGWLSSVCTGNRNIADLQTVIAEALQAATTAIDRHCAADLLTAREEDLMRALKKTRKILTRRYQELALRDCPEKDDDA